jgi:hypothetical protein
MDIKEEINAKQISEFLSDLMIQQQTLHNMLMEAIFPIDQQLLEIICQMKTLQRKNGKSL